MLYLSYVMLYLPCMKCSSVKLRCGKLCATDLHAHGDCYWQGGVMMAKIVHSAVNDRAADAPALRRGREVPWPRLVLDLHGDGLRRRVPLAFGVALVLRRVLTVGSGEGHLEGRRRCTAAGAPKAPAAALGGRAVPAMRA